MAGFLRSGHVFAASCVIHKFLSYMHTCTYSPSTFSTASSRLVCFWVKLCYTYLLLHALFTNFSRTCTPYTHVHMHTHMHTYSLVLPSLKLEESLYGPFGQSHMHICHLRLNHATAAHLWKKSSKKTWWFFPFRCCVRSLTTLWPSCFSPLPSLPV